MNNSIRKFILEEYKKTGKPISIESVATQKKISIEDAKKDLNNTPPFDNYQGLRIDQIINLIDFYGEGILFVREIEELVKNFKKTKIKIEKFEKKSKEKKEGS